MSLKLFVADDSETIQKIIRLAFAAEDVVIDAVADGTLVLERVKAWKPDVILADVFMPGCSGYHVCASIKGDPSLAGTAVVLMIGSFEFFDPDEAARVRCDAHIFKPFDTSEMVALVQKLAAKQSGSESNRPLTQRARESFLGPGSILDLFGPATPVAYSSQPSGKKSQAVSEELVDRVVEKVVRRMSEEVIREVAWEVVPEMSEMLIRRRLEQPEKS